MYVLENGGASRSRLTAGATESDLQILNVIMLL
jgi:hypothetical protein